MTSGRAAELHRIASRLFLLPLPLRPSSLASHLVVVQACCASFDTNRPHCHEARSPMFVMRSIDMLGTSVSDASPDCSMSRTTSVYGQPMMMMLGSISDPGRNLGGSASRKLPHTMLSTTSTASEGDSFALPRPAVVSMFRKGARRSTRLLGYRIRIELGMHMCRGRRIDGRRR
jgi:hypothetical protein